jgi:hypothetical protein
MFGWLAGWLAGLPCLAGWCTDKHVYDNRTEAPVTPSQLAGYAGRCQGHIQGGRQVAADNIAYNQA